MSDQTEAKSVNLIESKKTDTVRTGTPRKSKAKELLLVEEFCVFCYGSPSSNDEDFEELLRCSECLKYAHPTCLEIPVVAVERTKLYDWQCNDCKGCFQCKKKTKEKSIILCDYCDRGFHTFCLEKKPIYVGKASWICPFCQDEEGEAYRSIVGDSDTKISENTKKKKDKLTSKCDESEENIFDSKKDFTSNLEPPAQCPATSNLNVLELNEMQKRRRNEIELTSCSKKHSKLKEDCIGEERPTSNRTVQESGEEEQVNVDSGSESFVQEDQRDEKSGQISEVDSIEAAPMKDPAVDVAIKEEIRSLTNARNEPPKRRLSQRLSTITPCVNTDQVEQPSEGKMERTESVNRKNIDQDGPQLKSQTSPRRRSRRFLRMEINIADQIEFKGKVTSEVTTPMKKGDENRTKCQKREKDEEQLSGKRKQGAASEKLGEERNCRCPGPSLAGDLSENRLEKTGTIKLEDEKCEDDSWVAEVKEDNATKASEDERDAIIDGNLQVVRRRKRGRPRKNPISEERSSEAKMEASEHLSTVKQMSIPRNTQSPLRRRESKQTPTDRRKGDEEMESGSRRVLRKTSREPAMTPTTARTILSAQTVNRKYPLRMDSGTSPAPKNQTDSFVSKNAKKSLITPTRSPLQRRTPTSGRKSTPKTATPTESGKRESKKDCNKLISKGSSQKKSDLKSSERKKAEKTKPKDAKFGRESAPKRKLSFEEKTKDSKRSKAQIEECVDDKRNQWARYSRDKGDKDGTGTGSHGTALENVVSLEDEAMFEEAQKLAKEEMKKADSFCDDQGIKRVYFGGYEVDTWYSSPYPSEYKVLGKVFVCEYCLKYMKSATILRRHMAKCSWRHPPGDEIYRKNNISIFEVDGEKSSTYCQNLCLFAKLFLDHKTLYYEVEPFLFYVMTVADCFGCHMVGYFSKEKVSFLNYNVSCILVLPHCMRKGYGKILIDFSYLLSRVEGKIGSPERPLSDLGLISYRSYWKDVLLRYLTALEDARVSIKEMSHKTSVMSNDLISTMQYLGILKYWKGKHFITVQEELLDAYATKAKSVRKLSQTVEQSCLEWTPKDYGNGKNKAKYP